LEYRVAEKTIHETLQHTGRDSALQKVVEILYDGFEKYTWVGIYVLDGDTLVLGPWKGAQATEHVRIPLGTGVCGAAAKTGKTERVDDVLKDKRYLSCFLSTRSEIVVPIRKGDVVLGEIDIDSETPAAFEDSDVVFLEKVADMLSEHI
jgi:putative methionine-R-sulfoxide reductase with GAF domain